MILAWLDRNYRVAWYLTVAAAGALVVEAAWALCLMGGGR